MSEHKGVVVSTGASAGVGRACVRAFADHGYDIALIARGVEGLEGAKKEVEDRNQKAAYYSLDLADADAIEAATERIERELGPISIWINNAMNSVFSPIK